MMMFERDAVSRLCRCAPRRVYRAEGQPRRDTSADAMPRANTRHDERCYARDDEERDEVRQRGEMLTMLLRAS